MVCIMNPYTRLLEKCCVWSVKVRWPKTVEMLRYIGIANQATASPLSKVYERATAADQLGFDVHIRAINNDLVLFYVERPPPPPKEIL